MNWKKWLLIGGGAVLLLVLASAAILLPKERTTRRQYSAQVFITTKGKWIHRMLVDTPEIRPGQRLEVELVYEKEDSYYGGLSDEDIKGYSQDQRTFRQAFPEFKVKWIRTLRVPWRLRIGGRLSHNDIEPNAADGILSALDPLGADGGYRRWFDAEDNVFSLLLGLGTRHRTRETGSA